MGHLFVGLLRVGFAGEGGSNSIPWVRLEVELWWLRLLWMNLKFGDVFISDA